MSAFLRNIARRAAGLPAEVPVQANVASTLPAASADVPLVESAATDIAPQSATVPVTTASPLPAQGLQRRAETPAVAPPVVASPVAPRPLLPLSIAPLPLFPQHPAMPAALLTESASAVASQALSEAAVSVTPQPIVVREVLTESPKGAEPPVKPAPADIPIATEKPPSAHAPKDLPAEPPTKVERTSHETVLKEILEGIYVTELAPLKPADPVEPRGVPVVEPRVREEIITADATTQTFQPRINSRVAQRLDHQELVAASEKRTVNVQIGTLELKLPSAPLLVPQTPAPEAGFEDFEAVRMYRIREAEL